MGTVQHRLSRWPRVAPVVLVVVLLIMSATLMALSNGSIGGSDRMTSPTFQASMGGYAPNDLGYPILIDTTPHRMSGKARYKLTSVEKSVLFDMNGDGTRERIAWVTDGNQTAFLAIDRNGNGIIDNGTELFGNHTMPSVSNGFKALAELEKHKQNGATPGTLDSEDSLFAKLLLWHDRNEDGVSVPDELSAASENLDGIGLGYSPKQVTDGFGNASVWEGWAIAKGPGFKGAREFTIFDVVFKRVR